MACAVLSAKPVGHHGALISPLIAQDGLYEVLAFGGIDAVDVVVRRHHRPRLGLLDGYFEALEIDFAESPLRDVRIGVHAVGFLVVGSEVLDARTHLILLDAPDIRRGRFAGHHGVFGVVFEVASAERVSHDIDGRSQEHVGTILLHLLTDGGSHLLDELGVPCRGEQGADGEMRTVVSSLVALSGGIDTKSGRSVGQHDGGYAERIEREGGSGSSRHEAACGSDDSIVAAYALHTCSDDEMRFVLERHFGQCLLLVDSVLKSFFRGTSPSNHSSAESIDKILFHGFYMWLRLLALLFGKVKKNSMVQI